jgi:hypothetical protein
LKTLIAGKVLPWQRFWAPWGTEVRSIGDGRGFLENPEGRWGRIFNPAVRTIQAIAVKPFLVLSGQPGLGKTTEIERLTADRSSWLAVNERLIHLRGREIPDATELRSLTVESVIWRDAINAGDRIRLVVDGVDETLSWFPTFLPVLRKLMAEVGIGRIRILLTCRVADWDTTGGDELCELFGEHPDSYLFELCPLRLDDFLLAARESGVDPEKLLKFLQERDALDLAARPVTLRLVLDIVAAERPLPANHHALYAEALLHLCQEVNSERSRYVPRRAPASHLLVVAQRTAALMLLSGKAVIVRNGLAKAEHEVAVQELLGGRERADQTAFDVSDEVFASMLDTPLFSSRGHDRFGFSQKIFAEHLAARHLLPCSLRQLRRLLCVHEDGREWVGPAVAEIAAVLAAGHSEWWDYLVAHEPEVLFRADASSVNSEQRKLALDALLRRLDRQEAVPDHVVVSSRFCEVRCEMMAHAT